MGFGLNASLVNAATLSAAKVTMGDSRPSQTGVNYTTTASNVTTSPIKCIKLVFATTATGSTAPIGFDSTVGAVGINNAGTSYVPTPASLALNKSVNGTLLLTDAAGQTPASAGPLTVSINGITNSSVVDTAYFLRINTFNNDNCAADPVDSATVAFINTNGSTLSLTIDNTLSFTVSGQAIGACGTTGVTSTVSTLAVPDTIPFGTVATNAIACQTLAAATNATGGFTIYIRDNGQLANTLAQQIPDVGSDSGSYTTNGYTNGTPGATFTNNTSSLALYPGFNQGAYGYTTGDSSLSTGPGAANRFTNPAAHWASYGHSANASGNAEIAYEPVGVVSTNYSIAHQVGITPLTQPGTYTTTVIYTCVPLY